MLGGFFARAAGTAVGASLVATMVGVGPGAAAYSGNPHYYDIHRLTPLAQRAIVALYRGGIMNGTAPGKFSPYIPITRAQAVKFVVNALGLAVLPNAGQTYIDVSPYSQYFGRIEAAVNAGILQGMANSFGDFYPSTPITRVDFAVLATNALGDQSLAQSLAGDTSKYPSIKDLGGLSASQIGDVDAMMEVGIVPPYNATRFAPFNSLNREEFAVALYRLYNVLNSEQPTAALLSAAQSSVAVNQADQLVLRVTDENGNPVPSSALAGDTITYRVTAANATTTVGDASVNSSGMFSATGAGVYDIDATISGGNLVHPITTNTVMIQVAATQAASKTTLTSSANPSVVGQALTFRATVSSAAAGAGSPAGTVKFYDGTTNIGTIDVSASGTATLTPVQLPLGAHSITAVYSGDANFATSTSQPLTQTVNQAQTTTKLASSTNPSVSGQHVTYTATVAVNAPGAGTPTGTVTFYDGTTKIGTIGVSASGTATLSPVTPPVGANSITARYSGDANFAASTSAALTQTVNQGQTTTKLASSASPSVFGQPLTFTATVSANAPGAGTPTGTVTFYDGTTKIGTIGVSAIGTATLSPVTPPLGAHSITATYSGDANFAASTSAALTQTVNEAQTTTKVVSNASPSVFGQPLTFTATVSVTAPGAGTPTGTVTFYDGTTRIGTIGVSAIGTATLSPVQLPLGAHSITATYSGDANFAGSTSAALTQTVNQAQTTTKVVSNASPSVFGQPLTFTATVSVTAPGAGTPTGTVTFYDGTTKIGTIGVSASGTATLSPVTPPVGANSITATYSGDANFAGSTSAVLTQTVNQAQTTTKVVSSADPSVLGQPLTFTATVSVTAPGAGTPTGTVTFYDGTTKIGTIGVSTSGTATLSPVRPPLGANSITATYSGDANFAGSTSAALTQTVN